MHLSVFNELAVVFSAENEARHACLVAQFIVDLKVSNNLVLILAQADLTELFDINSANWGTREKFFDAKYFTVLKVTRNCRHLTVFNNAKV